MAAHKDLASGNDGEFRDHQRLEAA